MPIKFSVNLYFSIQLMTVKLCRYALCVGVRDNVCLMIYDDDLSALEIRAEFSSARIGTWYRFEINENGEQNWEKVDELLPTRVERTNGAKHKELVKICVPIFCVPNLTNFGCKWRKARTASTNEKWNIELYSPRLKSSIKINANVKQLVEKGIRETEHCHAFLTFNFVQSGSTVQPPQWSLNSVDDIQNPHSNAGPFHDDVAFFLPLGIPLPLHCSATIGKPTEWGFLKKVDKDSNENRFRLGSILCFSDGIIAYGRILPLREGRWRAEEGDSVGFCSIEIGDLFEKPVRVAFNVLNWKYQHATSDELLEDDSSLIAFDPESKFHLASTVSVRSREGSETEVDSMWDVQSRNAKALVPFEQPPKQQQNDIKEAMREDKRRFLPSQQQMQLHQYQQQQQQLPLAEKDKPPVQDGVCVFTHTKGDDIFLRLFDKQLKCFTNLLAVNKKKVPFPPGHSNPTSDWFRISYRKQKTQRTVAIEGLCLETELSFLPSHLTNPSKWDLWVRERLMDTKLEKVEM